MTPEDILSAAAAVLRAAGEAVGLVENAIAAANAGDLDRAETCLAAARRLAPGGEG